MKRENDHLLRLIVRVEVKVRSGRWDMLKSKEFLVQEQVINLSASNRTRIQRVNFFLLHEVMHLIAYLALGSLLRDNVACFPSLLLPFCSSSFLLSHSLLGLFEESHYKTCL